jgi:hypothetical protein
MEHAVNEKTKKWRARCFSSESRQEAPALLTFFLFFFPSERIGGDRNQSAPDLGLASLIFHRLDPLLPSNLFINAGKSEPPTTQLS